MGTSTGRIVIVMLVLLASSAAANAQIVYSGVVNLAIPNTGTGLYVNVVDNSTYTGPNVFPTFPGPGGNYDFNIFGTTTWSFFSPGSSGQQAPTPVPNDMKGYVAATTTSPVDNLAPGTLIGPASTFNVGTPSGSLVATGTDAIFGFRFRNETNDPFTTHFGWARVNMVNGQPGTLIDYAWESTPLTGIEAGAVPEPTAIGLVGLTALALLRRRHRYE